MRHLSKDNPINSIDFGPLPPELNRRGVAEEETRRDLAKSYAQLLADAHHEMTDPNNDPAIKVGFATRRIAGITTQAALATEAATKESAAATAANLKLQSEVAALNVRLYWLTVAVSILTVVATAAGCVQAYYSYASYTQDSRSLSDQAAKEKAALSQPPAKQSK